MSLLNWFTGSKSAKSAADSAASGRSEPVRTTPIPPPQRKSERMARRELLYSVVRESMARAGVLSSSYKFKVLSLDAAGRQFLVMIDLASSERMEADVLSEIESVVAQRAKARHELSVSAVYWRRNDQVGVGVTRAAEARSHMSVSSPSGPSQPAELASEPAPLQAARRPAAAASAEGKGFEPILDDEMEAFRAALANGIGSAGSTPASAPSPAPASASAAVPARRPPDFADTERRDDARTLSSTQHGDLT